MLLIAFGHLVELALLIGEVLALRFGQLLVQLLDFLLVLDSLRLEHRQFGGHRLKLPGLILVICTEVGELLEYLWTRVALETALDVLVEALLLLLLHVQLLDLLCLLDKAFLIDLHLLDELEGLRVFALKLTPAVDIGGVLELLCQRLRLRLFVKQFVVEARDLFLVWLDGAGATLQADELAAQRCKGGTKGTDLLDTCVVLLFALLKCCRVDLEFLVVEC